MIDLNHGSGYVYGLQKLPGAAAAEIVNKFVDDALLKARDNETPREYLGASRIGEPCARKLAYEYKKVPGKPFEPKILRIFAAGHKFEDMLIDWLKDAGFDLRTRNKSGGQFGFDAMNGRIKGHLDGVILSGPVELMYPYPLQWEAKALNHKGWTHLKNHGVKTSKPVYFAQIQTNMGYMNLGATLFTAMNKDTQELYHELVPFDAAVTQYYSDRAVEIIITAEAGSLPERISKDPTSIHCRFCDHNEVCWKEG